MEDKWNPCSERSPEKDGLYLVSGGGKVWIAKCFSFRCFRAWANDVRNPVIEAWMPLPEPWRSKQMCGSMIFPATVDEFMEEYKVVDSEHVYSNGMEMVPIFRMKQWFEHEQGKADVPPRYGKWNKAYWKALRCSECNKLSEYYTNFCPNCGADMRGEE